MLSEPESTPIAGTQEERVAELTALIRAHAIGVTKARQELRKILKRGASDDE